MLEYEGNTNKNIIIAIGGMVIFLFSFAASNTDWPWLRSLRITLQFLSTWDDPNGQILAGVGGTRCVRRLSGNLCTGNPLAESAIANSQIVTICRNLPLR